jgi:hypothetical protein
MSRESEMNFALSTTLYTPEQKLLAVCAQLRVNNSSVHLLRAEKVMRAILGFILQTSAHSDVFPKQKENKECRK